MPVPSEALPKHLARGLQPVYAVYGEEVLLRLEAVDAIRAAARSAGFGARSSFTLLQTAHFDWNAVWTQTQTQTLFAERQLIEIHLPNGKPGKEGAQVLPKLSAALAQPHAGHTLLLLHLGALDFATEKSAWFKALGNTALLVQARAVASAQLPNWLAQRLAQRAVVLKTSERTQCLAFLAEHVQGNLLAAQQEIEKLALLHPNTADPDAALSLAQLQASVQDVARYDVFRLFTKALGGHAQAFTKMLFGLRDEGVAAVLVHWHLSEEIRKLARVHQGVQAGRSVAQAVREGHVGFGRDRLYQDFVPRLTSKNIAKLQQAAYWVDGIVKGITHPEWPEDAWQALLRLGLMLVACARQVPGTSRSMV